MILVEGIGSAIVMLSIFFFFLYLVALLQMPTGHRPKIIPQDRFGRPLPPEENPDYRDTEGAQSRGTSGE